MLHSCYAHTTLVCIYSEQVPFEIEGFSAYHVDSHFANFLHSHGILMQHVVDSESCAINFASLSYHTFEKSPLSACQKGTSFLK